MADSKSREMTRRMFRNVSLAAVVSLTLLAAVQCVWAWRIYRDAVEAFRSRVESAAYKSVYEAFRTDPFGRVTADDVNVDLDDFGLYFTANMLETGTLQPYCAEVVDRADGDRIVMRRGDMAAIAHPAVSEIDIDDGGRLALRVTVSVPVGEMWGEMWGVVVPSAAIVVLMCCVLALLLRTMFRQKSLGEMRRDLTRNITHELKTPIAVAVAANDALRNFPAGADPVRRARYADIVAAQLSQLSSMVEHILAVSVAEQEDMRLRCERFALRPVLEQAAAKYAAVEKRVGFSFDVADDLYVCGDRFHLSNVVSTLFDNAVKYSGAEVRIAVAAREVRHGAKSAVEVEVADNGMGIEAKALEHIFEKFYRVPTGNVQCVRGYGLGLYYARCVVERHGGRITARSRAGEGTVITVVLPDDGKQR